MSGARYCLVALTVALSTPLPAQNSDARAIVSATSRIASEAAWDRGIAPALEGALADSAVLLWPGAPIIRGKAQIARFFAVQPASLPTARFMWSSLHLEGMDRGNLALDWGVMSVNRPAVGGAPAVHRIGRYVAIWQRANAGAWRLIVFAPIGLLPANEVVWHDSLGPRELPSMALSATPPSYVFGRLFASADSTFAADARNNHAAAAFGKWAANDAVSFSSSGEINFGAAKIRAAIAAGGDAEWKWAPVLAGVSFASGGYLGYTVGQATITSRDSTGKVQITKSKYVTFWRRDAVTKVIKFVVDAGSARP